MTSALADELLQLLTALILTGCATTGGPKAETGKDGTIPYTIEVESSDPGSRIEVNNEYVGKTPLMLKVFGDKDGTFHNFGSYEYKVTASPVRAGQQAQTKVFRTGGWFTSEDKIPKKIFFDFGLAPEPAR